MAMTKRYDRANKERYGGAIEALDEAGKTGKAEVEIEKVQQNTAQRQQLEAACQQTCGAKAALYEFAPQEEGDGAEAANQNGQAVEEELVEA